VLSPSPPDLPSNFVAWGVLRHLGFHGAGTLVPGAHLGNIVLCKNGRNGADKSLTVADLKLVEEAYQAYRKEVGDADEEEGVVAETAPPEEKEIKKRPAETPAEGETNPKKARPDKV
jgi:hypothetical protein